MSFVSFWRCLLIRFKTDSLQQSPLPSHAFRQTEGGPKEAFLLHEFTFNNISYAFHCKSSQNNWSKLVHRGNIFLLFYLYIFIFIFFFWGGGGECEGTGILVDVFHVRGILHKSMEAWKWSAKSVPIFSKSWIFSSNQSCLTRITSLCRFACLCFFVFFCLFVCFRFLSRTRVITLQSNFYFIHKGFPCFHDCSLYLPLNSFSYLPPSLKIIFSLIIKNFLFLLIFLKNNFNCPSLNAVFLFFFTARRALVYTTGSWFISISLLLVVVSVLLNASFSCFETNVCSSSFTGQPEIHAISSFWLGEFMVV